MLGDCPGWLDGLLVLIAVWLGGWAWYALLTWIDRVHTHNALRRTAR